MLGRPLSPGTAPRKPRQPLAPATLCLLLFALGCEESAGEVRTWVPADHSPTQSTPVDPHGGTTDSRTRADAPTSAQSSATPEEREARAAASLFQVTCARCHGPTGVGGGPELPPGVQVSSFADPAWQASKNDEALVHTIQNGQGLMPAFGERIRPEGIQALVRHIRRLGQGATRDGANEVHP